MRIKFLSANIVPWYCFHMGGHISCVHHPNQHSDHHSRQAAQTVKLIRSDGMVKIYHRPVEAAELMLEFPKHLVCHADSFFIGQKVPALSETDRLQLGNKYFLLPRHFFQTVLSFVTIASFASVDDADVASASKKKEFVKKLAATCKPFDILKSASGNLQIRVSDEFITKLMEDGRLREEEEKEDNRSNEVMMKMGEKVCTTPQLQKDYSQLVGFRRSVQWRPKLDTIREKKDKKKIGGFGIKKKKMKTQTKVEQQKGRRAEKEKEKKEKKKERKRERKERKKERKEKKEKEKKEEKERKKEKKEKEKPERKAPPPTPPPPPSIPSSSSKIKWKKLKKL